MGSLCPRLICRGQFTCGLSGVSCTRRPQRRRRERGKRLPSVRRGRLCVGSLGTAPRGVARLRAGLSADHRATADNSRAGSFILCAMLGASTRLSSPIDEHFDGGQFTALLGCHERERVTAVAHAGGAADAVDVNGRVRRECRSSRCARHTRHVESARGEIGCHEDLEPAGAQGVKHARAAAPGRRPPWISAQATLARVSCRATLGRAVFRAREDDGEIVAPSALEELPAVPQVSVAGRDGHVVLPDLIDGQAIGRDIDLDWDRA